MSAILKCSTKDIRAIRVIRGQPVRVTGSREPKLQRLSARLRGFEPLGERSVSAPCTEPSDYPLVASRIRFDAANRVEASSELFSRAYGESAKTGQGCWVLAL